MFYKRCKSHHHRKPRSKGGSNTKDNISIVRNLEHEAWHNLFHNFEAEQIAEIISNIWLDPKYKFLCVRR